MNVCTICRNPDESTHTKVELTVNEQPSTNPDPIGMAGYEPTEQLPALPLTICLWCFGELQSGSSIAELAVNLHEDGVI